MTQSMRDKLQALVEQWRNQQAILNASGYPGKVYYDEVADELESILATEPPAVTVRAGWVCKDEHGLYWHKYKPDWLREYHRWGDYDGTKALFLGAFDGNNCQHAITDPWETSHPNGGPKCWLEVK